MKKHASWSLILLAASLFALSAHAQALPESVPGLPSETAAVAKGASECAEIVGDWPYGTALVVASFDHYALFSNGRVLQVADVSDPSNPNVVGEVQIPDVPVDLEVVGNLAFVSAGYAGLRIIDLTTPAAPVEVGHLDMGFAYSVDAEANLVFVVDYGFGLRVIDVSTPSAPTELGTAEYPDPEAEHVAVSGDFVFLTIRADPSLRILDVSMPSAPNEVGSYSIDQGHIGGKLSVFGSTLFMTARDDLYLLDVSTPASPALLGTWSTGDFSTLALAGEPKLSGSTLYLTDLWDGILVFDISDPSTPTDIASFDSTRAEAVALMPGDVALLADSHGGLKVLDVHTPASPQELASIDVGGYFSRFAVSNGFAIGGGFPTTGLRVFDVTDLSKPVPAGVLDKPWTVQDVAIEGDIAVVAAHTAGLKVIDVSTPTAPVQLGLYDTNGISTSVEISGSTVYLADIYVGSGTTGLTVFDISDPSSPDRVATAIGTSDVRDIALQGSHLYAADEEDGLRIFDVTTTEPIEVGEVPAASAWGVAVSGNLAFLTSEAGVHVVDVSDPSSPNQVGLFELNAAYRNVRAYGSYVYLDSFEGKLLVIDVSDPSTPVEVSSIDRPTGGVPILESEHLFLSVYAAGLQILTNCHSLFFDGFESGDAGKWPVLVGGP